MTTETTPTKSTRPTHRAFAVTKPTRPDQEPFWTEIGAAWMNRDGKGFNLKLNLIPLNGAEIVVRLIEPKKAETKTVEMAEVA